MSNKYYKILVLLLLLLWALPVYSQTPSGSVTLSWDPNTETDLAGYRMYYGTASRDDGGYAIPNFHEAILVGTETYVFPALPYGDYYFAITAYDTSDNESGFSNEVFATLSSPGLNIYLTWDPNTEEDLAFYKIYYGTASRDDGGYIIPNFHDTIPAGTEAYTMMNLGDGIHYFALTAEDVAGNESGFSNEVWAVLPEFEPPYSEGVPEVLDISRD